MSAHHPRLTPARPDLAAETMRGIVDAPHFVKGEARIVFDGTADLRRAPVPDAPLDTQALHGEIFIEYDRDEEGWSWGQLQRDSYVGYVPSNALTHDIAEPTHRVSVLRTFLYGGPSIKLPPMATLSMGSRVTIVDRKDQFAITHRGHYLIADHCVPLTETASDFVSVAEQFIGIPYFWGGKTSIGLDCSGLVQVSLEAAGQFAPRDTDMQEHAVGEALPITPDLSGLQRGDLIFWKGHVGIMRDATHVLHASGHQMLVVSESLQGTADRILSKGAGPITSIKRLV
jgi:cell wall-associated NlpC family hydrolase